MQMNCIWLTEESFDSVHNVLIQMMALVHTQYEANVTAKKQHKDWEAGKQLVCDVILTTLASKTH